MGLAVKTRFRYELERNSASCEDVLGIASCRKRRGYAFTLTHMP